MEESLRHLSRAVEQSPSTVMITDTDGRMQYVNTKFTELTGYSREEAIGQNPRILKSGETPPEVYERLWETIIAGGEWRGEFHNKKKNGELYWESASISGVKDSSGTITHYLAVKEDITERKRLEDELRWKTAFLEAQVHSSPEGILVVDTQQRAVLFNDAFRDMWGIPHDIAEGVDDAELLQYVTGRAKDPTQFFARVKDIYAHPDQVVRDEMELANGTVWDRSTAPVLGRDDGHYYGRIWSFRNNTARKLMQEAIEWDAEVSQAMSELERASLASESVEAISGRVLDYGRELTGSRHGFVGYIAPDTGYLVPTTMTQEVWDECQVENKEYAFCTFGGLWGWVLNNKQAIMTNSPSLDERSTGTPEGHVPIESFLAAPALLGDQLVGMVALGNAEQRYRSRHLDIVKRLADFYAQAIQRARAAEALAERAEELARSNSDLQQFAYVASHDLQEPLRMVASYLQLLKKRYEGELGDDADTFIGFAVDGAFRMQRLIQDLLAYSRVGTQSKPLAPVDCEAVFEEAISNLRATIEEAGAAVTHTPLPTVVGDGGQLAQLLQNLIGNAIKFHGDEPPRVEVDCEQTVRESVFSVRDNGIGIAVEDLDRVFNVFERLHTDTPRSGTGIGLAICKRVVERHGGRIWVESVPGQGSAFRFTIPCREVDTNDH